LRNSKSRNSVLLWLLLFHCLQFPLKYMQVNYILFPSFWPFMNLLFRFRQYKFVFFQSSQKRQI
jgi:hypothetical protein